MLHKNLDGWDLAAQVRFLRQTHKGAFLLVEGIWDERVLSRFVDTQRCSIEVSFGKKNAIEALRLLEDGGFAGAIALVDADFDRLDERSYDVDGLILTDYHDLDLTVFLSPALSTLLDFRADKDKLAQFAKNSDLTLITHRVLTASAFLGYCRWVSDMYSLMLDFKRLSFEFVDETSLACDEEATIRELFDKSPAVRCDRTSLMRKIGALRGKGHDLKQLANGHDVAAVLGISLRALLGNRAKAQTWGSEIEAGLRMAFDAAAFRTTGIYRALKDWEHNNSRFAVLKTT